MAYVSQAAGCALLISSLCLVCESQLNQEASTSLLNSDLSFPYHIATALSASEAEPIRKGSCKRLFGLTQRQVEWCKKHYDFLQPIVIGTRLGLDECKRRFALRLWSCPIDRPNVFRRVLDTANPEAAFVRGIESAGITLAIARTCSRGNTVKHCGCDKLSMEKKPGNWTWGSCSDNFNKGSQYAAEFLSDVYMANRSTPLSAVTRHNYDIGRKIVGKSMQFLCKCHGVTGSCSYKTCWYGLPKIQLIGEQLAKKYDKIFQVVWNATQGKVESFTKDPLKKSRMNEKLVFKDTSVDYCQPNMAIGSLGTHGRECVPKVDGTSSCDEVCCRRGYNERRRIESKTCACKFLWCCKVHCKQCRTVTKKYTCL